VDGRAEVPAEERDEVMTTVSREVRTVELMEAIRNFIEAVDESRQRGESMTPAESLILRGHVTLLNRAVLGDSVEFLDRLNEVMRQLGLLAELLNPEYAMQLPMLKR